VDGRLARGAPGRVLGLPVAACRLHLLRVVPPGVLGNQSGHRLQKIGDAERGVADQPHSQAGVAPELLWIDVELDDRRTRGEQAPPAGGDLPELASHDEEHVGATDRLVGGAAVAPEDAEGKGVVLRDRALAADRRRYGQP